MNQKISDEEVLAIAKNVAARHFAFVTKEK
jgi:hypothetical protein